MTIDVRPEIGQSGFQRTLGGDVPLVGPKRLNKTRVDVVVGGTPEETNSGVLKRPDIPIPGVEAEGLVIVSRWMRNGGEITCSWFPSQHLR